MIEPVVIEELAVYDNIGLEHALGVSGANLKRARTAGTLRHTIQGKRILYLGRWILDWLEAESLPKRENCP